MRAEDERLSQGVRFIPYGCWLRLPMHCKASTGTWRATGTSPCCQRSGSRPTVSYLNALGYAALLIHNFRSVRSLTGPPLQRYTALLRRHRSGPLPLLRLATQVVNALGTLLRYRRLNLPRILEIFKRFVWVFLRAKTEWARTHHSTDVLLSDMGPKLDEY